MRLTPSATHELLERHGIRPMKRLGQHFLIDPNIVDRIVRAIGGQPGDPVLEIGAGLGTLTRSLVEAGYDVTAYEVDQRLAPVLQEVVGSRARVVIGDAARLDWEAVLDGRKWVMAANLPYNVGTPLLLDALRHADNLVRFVVMLQAEVIERLTADVGDSAYGIPSVVAGLHCLVRDRFAVPAQVFLPRPAVDSAVVVLDRIAADTRSEAAIELAARAFGQRRKMLRSSMRNVLTEEQFAQAGVDPTARPEVLGPSDWLALAKDEA